MSLIKLVLNDEQETERLGSAMGSLQLVGSVWLNGDLGVGKTTLTRYWLRALGHEGAVKSPTYTLVEPYELSHEWVNAAEPLHRPKRVYHADLYRLQDPEELGFIGFDDYLQDGEALSIIEWAERAQGWLPPPLLTLTLTRVTETMRQVSIHCPSDEKVDKMSLAADQPSEVDLSNTHTSNSYLPDTISTTNYPYPNSLAEQICTALSAQGLSYDLVS